MACWQREADTAGLSAVLATKFGENLVFSKVRSLDFFVPKCAQHEQERTVFASWRCGRVWYDVMLARCGRACSALLPVNV